MVPEDAGPLVVTNARGTFVQTPRRADGVARSGFSNCPLNAEGLLLAELYRVLWALGVQLGWQNRFPTIAQAREKMDQPWMLVVSDALLHEVAGGGLSPENIEKLMAFQGHFVEVDGLKVLAGGLPRGALLTAPLSETGFYVRTGDWLSVFVQRADRSILLVE
jgi:hypothetical protein